MALTRRTHTSSRPPSLDLSSVREASELPRASRRRIYDLLSDGRLTRHKDASRVLIRRDEIERHLRGEPVGPQGVRNPKDSVETKAKSLVCKGRVPLAVMQRAISVNWATALAAVGHPGGE